MEGLRLCGLLALEVLDTGVLKGGRRVTQDEAGKMGRAWRAMAKSQYFTLRSVDIQGGPGLI